jgi:hypothetical protein
MKTISMLAFLQGLFFALSAQGAMTGMDVVSGARHTLDPSSSKATVYVFLSARCPCSNGHEGALKALHQEFAKKGFQFVGIHSNQNETLEETRAHFAEAKLPFPVVEDEGAKLADEFRALKTPHVFVKKGEESLFEGGVDDTASGVGSKKQYLRNALLEIDSGKAVRDARVRVLGCTISRSKS